MRGLSQIKQICVIFTHLADATSSEWKFEYDNLAGKALKWLMHTLFKLQFENLSN